MLENTKKNQDELILDFDPNKIQDDIIDEEITEVRNPWFVRTFSKMGEGSLRAAIIVLAVSGMGPAVYSFHIAYHNVGIIPTFLMTIFVVAAMLLSIDIWIFSYKKHP